MKTITSVTKGSFFIAKSEWVHVGKHLKIGMSQSNSASAVQSIPTQKARSKAKQKWGETLNLAAAVKEAIKPLFIQPAH